MKVIVHYPKTADRLVLRTEDDWDLDIEAATVSDDGTRREFEIEPQRSYFYFKPILVRNDGETVWARGNNFLALRNRQVDEEVWPYFVDDETCSFCGLHQIEDEATGTTFRYRVFQPPGYAENNLQRYPVLYLQDGQNVFFRDEEGMPHDELDWKLDETLVQLNYMNAVEKVIAVGVYPADREHDYVLPGCESYARFLARTLKPAIDREYRTKPGPKETAIMGSSLGGVASFYTAWQWPRVFGKAACLSSTFGWRDDLAQRVLNEKKRNVIFYLDSGWPGDNYEVTRDMRAVLMNRGWVEGRDLVYYAYPDAHHDEHAWALRCHIPIQVFFGRRPGPKARARASSRV